MHDDVDDEYGGDVRMLDPDLDVADVIAIGFVDVVVSPGDILDFMTSVSYLMYQGVRLEVTGAVTRSVDGVTVARCFLV